MCGIRDPNGDTSKGAQYGPVFAGGWSAFFVPLVQLIPGSPGAVFFPCGRPMNITKAKLPRHRRLTIEKVEERRTAGERRRVVPSKCPKCLDGGQMEAVEVSDRKMLPPGSDQVLYDFCRE